MDRTVEAEVPDAVLERGPRPDKKVEMYLAQLPSHSKKLSPLLLMKNFYSFEIVITLNDILQRCTMH